MCHPWLAAGISCFIVALLVHELAPLTRQVDRPGTALESGLLGAKLRTWFRQRMAPVVDTFLALGLTANGVTFSQLGASVVCGVAYAQGWMFTAGWILITSGTLDVVDGEMARRQGQAGPRGALIDSVVDRYGESAVFAGLAAFYRDAWVLWGVLAAWVGSFLVSYTRARAEGLGIDCRDGLIQRPERYVILGISSMLSAIVAQLVCNPSLRHGIIVAAILVLAVLANVTALQRLRIALRRLS